MLNSLLLYALTMLTPNYAVVSWYGGPGFEGNLTASGTVFDSKELTVAHKDLAFGTKVLFKHKDRYVFTTVTDRGPYVEGREFDLSQEAAEQLGIKDKGVVEVQFIVISD